MPEIGATLRETRIRAGLEISDIEASTKIRAKYLRAIENEEWDLLPGPTFAKTFLRTYAETLELDARLLLEEYKARYERYDEHDLRPVHRATSTTRTGGDGRGLRGAGRGGHGGRRGRGPRPWMLGVGLLVIVAGALFALGIVGGSGGSDASSTTPDTGPTTSTTASRATDTTRSNPDTGATAPPASRTVRLQVVPTASVYVCLIGGDRKLINGRVLAADARLGTFRSRRFRIALGNGNVTLRIDGRTVAIPNTGTPVGYEITSERRTRLTQSELPQCG